MAMYPVELKIQLTPVFHQDPPKGRLQAGNQLIDFVLTETTVFDLQFAAKDSGSLMLEFLNKTDADCDPAQGLDKAIKIDWISFFGISDPRFVWQGIYTPAYPEPWYSQTEPRPAAQIKNVMYLGWNGTWSLDFTVPVFTWIHGTQSHGWLYD